MSNKVKIVNYTAEQTAALVEAYTGAGDDSERAAVVLSFSQSFGKAPASIRAKLVREKVYIRPAQVGKKGGVSKSDLVEAIAAFTETPADVLDSLAKATMFSLTRIVETFRELSAEKDDLSEELQGNPAE